MSTDHYCSTLPRQKFSSLIFISPNAVTVYRRLLLSLFSAMVNRWLHVVRIVTSWSVILYRRNIKEHEALSPFSWKCCKSHFVPLIAVDTVFVFLLRSVAAFCVFWAQIQFKISFEFWKIEPFSSLRCKIIGVFKDMFCAVVLVDSYVTKSQENWKLVELFDLNMWRISRNTILMYRCTLVCV